MTTPAKNTPAKSTPAKAETVKSPVVENKVDTPVVENNVSPVPDDKVVETEPKDRIPELLQGNNILASICQRYLDTFDKIAAYNKDVLAKNDSDWTSTKVLEEARKLGRPTDKDTKPNETISAALKKWESLVDEMNKARRAVIDETSKVLGITLSATAERNPEIEAPLKEERKIAAEIGKQLAMLASITNDDNSAKAVEEFLAKNPLPAVGRDQVHVFGSTDEKATPKYRVNVEVKIDDKVVVSESGFTKAALALPKFYPRGEAPKSDKLRLAWEAAGNSAEKTVVNPVEFDDEGENGAILHFTITKK
jgi:hypothetical protein